MNKHPRSVFAVGLLLTLALALTASAALSEGAVPRDSVSVKAISKRHLFTAVVTYPSPLPVTRPHTWTVRLFDRRHRPVTGARITVTGDMPAHGHGLPTAPIARARARGLYQLQGMMFQMPGRWYVQLQIRTATRLDTIRVRFTIAE